MRVGAGGPVRMDNLLDGLELLLQLLELAAQPSAAYLKTRTHQYRPLTFFL